MHTSLIKQYIQWLLLKDFFVVNSKLYFWLWLYIIFIIWELYLLIICLEQIHSSLRHHEFLLCFPLYCSFFSHKCAFVLNALGAPNVTGCKTMYKNILEQKPASSSFYSPFTENEKAAMACNRQFSYCLPLYASHILSWKWEPYLNPWGYEDCPLHICVTDTSLYICWKLIQFTCRTPKITLLE